MPFTKSVVDIAKVFDVDVEGEIGHVGQVAGGFDYQNEDTFTRPVEAARFVERTGVTSVAVAFGAVTACTRRNPTWIWSGCGRSIGRWIFPWCSTAVRGFRRISWNRLL